MKESRLSGSEDLTLWFLLIKKGGCDELTWKGVSLACMTYWTIFSCACMRMRVLCLRLRAHVSDPAIFMATERLNKHIEALLGLRIFTWCQNTFHSRNSCQRKTDFASREKESSSQKNSKSRFCIQDCMRWARDRETVNWPGLNADLENLVQQCGTCQAYQRNQAKEPMITHPIPEHPWRTVGCDFMDFGDKSYMILVDYYSDFF